MTKTALTALCEDVAPRNLADGFSHAEMLRISGLTADTVLTWYKRGFLSDFLVSPGRGNRRRYHGAEVIHLAVARELINLSLPVREALDLGRFIAAQIAGLLGNCGDLDIKAAVQKLALEREPCIAVFRIPENAELELWGGFTTTTGRHGFLMLTDCDGQQQIRDWMRRMRLVSVRIVDVVYFAAQILNRAQQVLGARKKYGNNTDQGDEHHDGAEN